MKVRITLDIDVFNTPYADAITYFIHQYSIDSTHTAENPDQWDAAEAVEHVVVDILNAEFADMVTGDDTLSRTWEISDVQSLPNP